jgi:long-chain fatty acid transport protein
MKHTPLWHKLIVFAVTLAFAASPSLVLASGFQLIEQNASGLGNAYAGQAAGARNASAIFYNPANMTLVKGKQFMLAGSMIDISTTFADASSTRPYLPTTPPTPVAATLGSAGGNAGGWAPVPNAYLSWQVSKGAWFGVGVNAPFGLKTEWESDFMGRFKALKSDVKTLNINPSVAFKVGESLSIGGGASYQQLKATLTSQVPYGGISAAIGSAAGGTAGMLAILGQIGGLAGLALEGPAAIEGSDWKWGYNVGATLHVGKGSALAASYRSAIKHEITGTATFTGAPTFNTSLPGGVGAIGAAINGRFANGDVNATVELPETFSVAFSAANEKAELLADYTWTGWSSVQDLTIKRNDSAGTVVSSVPLTFKDTWRVGVGLNYQIGQTTKLRLGYAHDKAPVQDKYRTPRLPDNDRNWIAGGLEFKFGKAGAFDIGYAHLFLGDMTSNLPNQDTPTSAPSGNLVGSYKGSVNIVSAGFHYSF